MTWWAWLLVWLALLALAASVLVLVGLRLWRRASALGRELSATAEALADATGDQAARPGPRA